MIKKVIKYILIAPLLMAFQCNETIDPIGPLTYNIYKVNVTAQSNLSTNDTLWITGRVSSQAFDIGLNDSIFASDPEEDIFSIYKLVEPTLVTNAKDAVDKFDIVFDTGLFSNGSVCENAQFQVTPMLEKNGDFFNYKIGLTPLEAGDYVISWQNAILKNEERNEFIINNYLLENSPDEIGFDTCGTPSWRVLNESDKEYYFTVE